MIDFFSTRSFPLLPNTPKLTQAAREMRDAARVMGDARLWALMDGVSAAVRRDVVFAASLYVA